MPITRANPFVLRAADFPVVHKIDLVAMLRVEERLTQLPQSVGDVRYVEIQEHRSGGVIVGHGGADGDSGRRCRSCGGRL